MSIGILMEERAAESKKTTVLPAVLGLHIGHDASASLVVDGEIVAAIGEERLSRTKQHYGFPFEAIGKVLEIAGLELGMGGDRLHKCVVLVTMHCNPSGCGMTAVCFKQ